MKPSTIIALKTFSRPINSIYGKDFFGIADITSKDIAAAFKSGARLEDDKFIIKYNALLEKREALANEERTNNFIFGEARFDDDNVPSEHGQFDKTNERKKHDTIEIKQKFVSKNLANNPQVNTAIVDDDIDPSNPPPGYNPPYKISEVKPEHNFADILELFKDQKQFDEIGKYSNVPPATFFFRAVEKVDQQDQDNVENVDFSQIKLSGSSKVDIGATIEEAAEISDKKPPLIYDPEKDQIPIQDLDKNSEEFHERSAEDLKKLEWDQSLDSGIDTKNRKEGKKFSKALDYLKAIRTKRIEPTAKGLKHRIENHNPYSLSSNIKLDSMGFNNYTEQVPDWSKIRKIEILNHLRASIVYNNYDLVVINKPYGLASHNEQDSRHYDINGLLQELAPSLKYEKLYLAHRLDKFTTGLLVFASDQQRAKQLNHLFKSDQIQKTYWCITRGVPNIPAGIIDIPIGELKTGDKLRSCLCPENLDDKLQLAKRFREARRAVTEFKVIKSTKYVALVEVKPKSGVKHQIRCHLSFGLGHPILGDHKYSHLEKLAPQQLSVPLLNLLHLRQAKVRTLPLHLHAKTIVIPQVKPSGDPLFISAPLAPHFVQNMKTLKINYNRD